MGSWAHVRECKKADISKASGVLVIKLSYPFAFNGMYTVMCARYVHVVDYWFCQLYHTSLVLGRRAEAIHMCRSIVVVSTKQESTEIPHQSLSVLSLSKHFVHCTYRGSYPSNLNVELLIRWLGLIS